MPVECKHWVARGVMAPQDQSPSPRNPLPALARVKLWFLGPRDFPAAVVTLPEHVVSDLPDLLARARALNPAVPLENVVYTIWRLGSRRLDQNLVRRIPVRMSGLPSPGTTTPCR